MTARDDTSAPADAVWLLIGGTTRVFCPAEKGQPEVTVKLLRAPGGFGDVACVVRGRYTASVEALGPVAFAGPALHCAASFLRYSAIS